MKILMVNKFLFSAGGAEKYMISLGNELKKNNEVQYFGLDNKQNEVGNNFGVYASLSQNPANLIYSRKNKMLFAKLIDLYKPDVIHMNNISYQLTSSLIDAAKEARVPALMTIHDPQLVCPNHMFYTSHQEVCTQCLDMNFRHCVEKRCLKGSLLKSYLAYLESKKTHAEGKYDYLSCYISPSHFLQQKMIEGGYPSEKCLYLRNFYSGIIAGSLSVAKASYFLYYGRLSEEKGINLLLKALPENVKLVIAGSGPLASSLPSRKNVQYVGYKEGEELYHLIANAQATIYPSLWYENCPLSVMESIAYGTPVIGTNQAGIAELVEDEKTGLLFKPNDAADLREKILLISNNPEYASRLSSFCKGDLFDNAGAYAQKLMVIYQRSIDNAKTN
jgi:glycosyltransferase involved in cell wall biosynthesis